MDNHSEKQRKRVIGNPNLNLHYEPYYKGLSVQVSSGPLVKEWLERIYQSMKEQVAKHSRALALRIDLRFPRSYWGYDDEYLGNGYLADFTAHLQESLNQLPGNRNHDLMVLAAREYEMEERKPHFHLLILLNGNAIRGTGKWDLWRDNLYSRLHEAWAYSLGMYLCQVEGLIQFSNGSEYLDNRRNHMRYGSMLLHRGDDQMFEDLFKASSYLAKVATKNFYDGCRPFISPRLKFTDW